MKPSRYTFHIVPDHEGTNRRFSFSRNTLIIILSTLITILSGLIFSLILFTPKALDHQRMKTRYDEVIGERTKVLELYRDLERIKQMELVVQKALGTDLVVSESGEGNLVQTMNDDEINLEPFVNIPSVLPVK